MTEKCYRGDAYSKYDIIVKCTSKGVNTILYCPSYIFFDFFEFMKQFAFTRTATEPSRKILTSSWGLRSGTFKTPILSWIRWSAYSVYLELCRTWWSHDAWSFKNLTLSISDVLCDQFSLLNSVVFLVFFLCFFLLEFLIILMIALSVIRRSRMPIMI